MAAITTRISDDDQVIGRIVPRNTPDAIAPASDASAISWGAIFAGAAGAAALSLILLILGTGLGLSSVSPWAQTGVTATALGVSTILWITFTQVAASGMGGYLAGRLRTKWPEVHTDEVYFRDTAHGFLAWAVASLTTAALLSSVIASIIGGGVQTISQAQTLGTSAEPMSYFVDVLFRKAVVGTAAVAKPAEGEATSPPTAEVARILTSDLDADELSPDDVRYLGQVVAQHTGMSAREAEQRVLETHARMQAKMRSAATAAKVAAEAARKASAYAALWLFVSLLVGAFVASLAATYGGRQRDL